MRKLGKLCRDASDFKAALDYHERSLSLAKELKDTLNIIYILNQLGTDFRRLGVLDEAAVRHYEAISYCEKYSDHTSFQARKNKVVSLNGIGNMREKPREPPRASHQLRKHRLSQGSRWRQRFGLDLLRILDGAKPAGQFYAGHIVVL